MKRFAEQEDLGPLEVTVHCDDAIKSFWLVRNSDAELTFIHE